MKCPLPSTLAAVRGVKVLLPPPGEVGELFRFIDLAAGYGVNTLMIELGGAMEYKSHPEVNEGWIEYAAEMGEYPGKGAEFQTHTEKNLGWHRNSIHSDNGGGLVVPQAEIRAILDYCEGRGVEVIPEGPSLSHSDYLLTRHPELAERAGDPHPDAYCPSNPATYELLFDILGEVVSLFRPRVVNIGHDELYTACLCPRCKGRGAPELYAADIVRIRDFLASKGVRTMIWAEKLLDAHFIDSGSPCGGAGSATIPELYPCRDLLPDDILMLHWYWSLDRRFDQTYVERGFPFAFGNFSGRGMVAWKERSKAPGFFGYMISNWGRTDMPPVQRNGILADLAYDALMEASPDPDAERPELWGQMFRSLFERRLAASPAGARHLFIRHATSVRMDYRYFVDGFYIKDETYRLGEYRVRLADGSEVVAPVLYGLNISNDSLPWERPRPYDTDAADGNQALAEVAYSTLPVRLGDRTEYIMAIDLPAGAEVSSVTFLPAPGREGAVRYEVLPLPEDEDRWAAGIQDAACEVARFAPANDGEG